MSKICIQATVPAPPPLPSPFSIPPLPAPTLPDLTLCCQIHPLDYLPELPPLPFTWPGPVNPAIIATINAAMMAATQAVQDLIDQTIPDCPRA